jgi:hypothetical protein
VLNILTLNPLTLVVIVGYMFCQFSCPWYLVILQFYYHNVLLSMVRELFEFYDLGLVVIDLNANDFAHCKLKL